MTAVIDLAEPPLQAAIMINISIMLSLTFELPLCTMKTFWFRMDVPILTLVSPFAKLPNSQLSGLVPSLSQMASVSVGCDLPEKILTFLMSEEKTVLGQNVQFQMVNWIELNIHTLRLSPQAREIQKMGFQISRTLPRDWRGNLI